MQDARRSNATLSTLRFKEFPSLFDPRFTSLSRRLIPRALHSRLDPFEASIERFVREVAATVPPGKLVLDAGAGEGRFKPFFEHTGYVGVDFAQGDPSWNYS